MHPSLTLTDVSITPGAISWTAAIILAITVCASATWYYLRTVPPLAGWRRIGMTVLRAAALLLLVVGLVDPVIGLVYTLTQSEQPLVLLDTSASMADPADPERSVEANTALSRVRERFGGDVRIMAFDTTVHPLDSENPDYSGRGTDISAALVSNDDPGAVSDIILISDGRWNLGADPLHAASPEGIPVHTVLAGSTDLPPELSVGHVSAPDVGHDGEEIAVTVALTASGRYTGSVPVTVHRDGDVVAETTIRFDNAMRGLARMTVPLSGPGRISFDVVAAPPDDTVAENNRRTFGVRVLERTATVTIIADHPSPDVAFLRRALEGDDGFDVRTVFARGIAFSDERTLPDPLDDVDCFVIVDGGGELLTGSVAGEVAVRIRAGAGCWFIGELPRDGSLASLVSVSPAEPGAVLTDAFTPGLTDDGIAHFLSAGIEGMSGDVWAGLPPVPVVHPVAGVRDDMRVLATATTAGEGARHPVLMVGNAGTGAVLAMPISGFWRWHLQMVGAGRSGFFSAFMIGTVRWLTTDREGSPLTVTTDRETYLGGERIRVEARLYNAVRRPVTGAEIRVVVDGDPGLTVFLDEAEPAMYTGTLPGLSAGTHTFRAVAYRDGSEFAAAEDTLAVSPTSLEQFDRSPDPVLMGAVAGRAGGMSVTTSGIDSVLAVVSPGTITERRESEHRPARGAVLLLAIMVLFATEWFIRRRRGMV
jgi:hypothetical protein